MAGFSEELDRDGRPRHPSRRPMGQPGHDRDGRPLPPPTVLTPQHGGMVPVPHGGPAWPTGREGQPQGQTPPWNPGGSGSHAPTMGRDGRPAGQTPPIGEIPMQALQRLAGTAMPSLGQPQYQMGANRRRSGGGSSSALAALAGGYGRAY